MSASTVVVLSFVAVGGITFLAGLLLLRWWPAVRAERLSGPTSTTSPTSILRWDEGPKTGLAGTVQRLGKSTSAYYGPARYRQRLAWAGHHDPAAVALFVGAKVALALGLCGLYFLYGAVHKVVLPNLMPVSLILTVVGFFLPDVWLRGRVKARQRDIVNALPDVLDMLMVCVESGMGFDAAVARVAEAPETRSGPLHGEMMRMHLEIRAGRPRPEALRAIGERTGVQEVKTMVSAFIQTDRLGTSLGKTLRVHAEAARVQRRHRAEERAHLAPLKMLMPTVFFLFPAFFLVTLAPSLLNMLKLMKSLSISN
jgi:tight adherence protein C